LHPAAKKGQILREDLHTNTHVSLPDSLQFTAAHKAGTPVNRKQKQDVSHYRACDSGRTSKAEISGRETKVSKPSGNSPYRKQQMRPFYRA
jgi:hypothetical protein